MWVKICGLTDEAAVQAVARSGASAAGFVFAPSRRQVTVPRAAALASLLPSGISKVGVFADQPLAYIQAAAGAVGLDYVQLHGQETPDFCRQVGLPVIKAFSITEDFPAGKIKLYLMAGARILLDSGSGGSGKAFAWEMIPADFPHPFILAGGLTAQNVCAAIKFTGASGVDVSSGVESQGRKDPAKIHEFVRRAKHCPR
ncbi:MAG: phosphoribosylanthranilate isomerase [Bacillota bacterium]|uniref:phosphoribosylanthranilate isomerase n=1 Tax=Desulfurispora thermophila TaxID=265470 RepID=UPI00037C2A2C|nr:phosphoribosylanthranilate isomerase [Desulfurispora thermophila]